MVGSKWPEISLVESTNMRSLILDPLQHCPGTKLLFDDVDYWTMFTTPVEGESLYRTRQSFEQFYGFSPKETEQLRAEYDHVYVVLPMFAVVGIDRPQLFVKLVEDLYRIIESKSPKKVAFFDSHDNAYTSNHHFDQKGHQLDAVFKTNFSSIAQSTYDSRVKSFPFFCFGPIDPLFVALTNKHTRIDPSKKYKECFWGSGAGGCFTLGMRPDIPDRTMNVIKFDRDKYTNSQKLTGLLAKTPALAHDQFMRALRSYRSFLVLNGTGKIHRRFFEGVTSGGLALVEDNFIIHPDEVNVEYPLNKRCTFGSPDELETLIQRVNTDDEFYADRMRVQDHYVETFLKPEWLRNYVEKNL